MKKNPSNPSRRKGELHRALARRTHPAHSGNPSLQTPSRQWVGLVMVGVLASATILAFAFTDPLPVLQQMIARWALFTPTTPPPSSSDDDQSLSLPPPPTARRSLDGVAVSSPELQNPTLVAVSVDNMIEGWPPSGLDEALLVYEFPAEASITRFLAVFDAIQDTSEIGPVRSARPYMTDLARSLGAVFVHSGGSQDSLRELQSRKNDVADIDEFSAASFFWRDRKRAGPHNLYTSLSLLKNHSKILNRALQSLEPLAWKEFPASSDSLPSDGAKLLIIGFPEPYTSRWRALPSERAMERVDSDGKTPLVTRQGERMRAETLVIQFAPVTILDAVGRRSINLFGSGEAMVVTSSGMELGQWSRRSPAERARLLDIEGNPLAIRPGRVWWTIVPPGTGVTFE